MAWSTGVKRGDKIKVAGTLVLVKEVLPGKAVVIVVGADEHIITDQERVQIIPSVFVSLGKIPVNGANSGSRLAFEAPRSIKLQRVP